MVFMLDRNAGLASGIIKEIKQKAASVNVCIELVIEVTASTFAAEEAAGRGVIWRDAAWPYAAAGHGYFAPLSFAAWDSVAAVT